MGQKTLEALAALKERVEAAEPDQRAKMQRDGLNGVLAQAIADAKSAGLTSAQVADFEAVQQAMDSDLSGPDAAQSQAQAPG